jgi:ankyrin repeat protein
MQNYGMIMSQVFCTVQHMPGIVKLIVQTLSSEYHPLPKDKENGRNLLIAVINQDDDSIRHILKEEWVNLHVRDNDLGTALSWAVKYRDIKLVEQLLARGADINIESDLTGGTALHDAVGLSCYEIVTVLVENGARINVKDYSESTPLDIAVTQDDARITKLLLAKWCEY